MAGRRPLETREALLIAFFALFLVAARAAFRWHLHIPGHSMVGTVFGLVLVRRCVSRPLAASLCGLLAGLVCAALGMGQGGPVIVLKLLLPAAVVDLARLRAADSPAALPISFGIAIGALAGVAGVLPVIGVEMLADLEPRLVALHALV